MRNPFQSKKEDTKAKQKARKPAWREWLDAAVFAIVAATLIRTFFVEAYTIPSESMEGTMLVNDYLFVSKLSYGPRLPMTPVAVPLVHNEMPFFGGKSYIDAVQWKYHRLPGFGHVERYDVVVFNFPEGDTVRLESNGEVMQNDDYYTDILSIPRADVIAQGIVHRPADKTDNYIKRCVAIPGDVIELKDGNLFVNGAPSPTFAHVKNEVTIANNGKALPDDVLEEANINITDPNKDFRGSTQSSINLLVQNKYLPMLQQIPGMKVTPAFEAAGAVRMDVPGSWTFPRDPAHYKWNVDNFGPLTIPKKGTSVTLTPENISLYRRVIGVYEGNKLEEKNGTFIINDQPATSYTFKMDYYWMMGDNRHNSLDSRYWGFVPEDHIVGKAWFVWLSYGPHGLRWSRLFHGIHSLEQ